MGRYLNYESNHLTSTKLGTVAYPHVGAKNEKLCLRKKGTRWAR